MRERVRFLLECFQKGDSIDAIERELLALMEGEPVAWLAVDENGDRLETCANTEHADPDEFKRYWADESRIRERNFRVVPLYLHPQPAAPERNPEHPDFWIYKSQSGCDDVVLSGDSFLYSGSVESGFTPVYLKTQPVAPEPDEPPEDDWENEDYMRGWQDAKRDSVDSRSKTPCLGCARGEEPVMLDEDGTKCSVSGNPGRLGHGIDDRFWFCEDHAPTAQPAAPEREAMEIVCLCGSTRFADLHAIRRWELEQEGQGQTVVLMINYLPHWWTEGQGWDGNDHFGERTGTKEMLDELHLRKIDLSTRVEVVNPEGYVGESTAKEINYARATGKPVTFMVDELTGPGVAILAQETEEVKG
jgi:hypothetical protein